MNTDSLVNIHQALCHPGVTRLNDFVKSRNLPYSVEDVRGVTKACRICCECKPRFYKPPSSSLIKATQPFERLNMDFKGPIPSSSRNVYILTIIDEYSRFPFAFPCPNISAQTVKSCLETVFSMFGLPSYIPSDRGTSFVSEELKSFLTEKSIATSRTTPYNPQGNGQTERYNGIIMKTINLALKQHKLDIKSWEKVLPDALHSIRSLISTATGVSPHERLFTFQRRSATGHSVPTWLSNPGPVLLKKHVRSSKYDSLVEKVELIEANPQYAHVRFQSGREDTVSIRHLAPIGNEEMGVSSSDSDAKQPAMTQHVLQDVPFLPQQAVYPDASITAPPTFQPTAPEAPSQAPLQAAPEAITLTPCGTPLRRSERQRRMPDRLMYEEK